MLKVIETDIPEVRIIEPEYFLDSRGYFCETYSSRAFADIGITTVFVQDNHSYSALKGTIRGHHFQNNPKSQAKLVRCVRGIILDVAVDLRKNSPTYKRWVSAELSEENHRQMLIPSGFSHGFMTLADHCEVFYKVDEFYHKEYDRSIIWNDPEIAVNWGIADPVLSDKDRNAPLLKDSDVNFVYAVY